MSTRCSPCSPTFYTRWDLSRNTHKYYSMLARHIYICEKLYTHSGSVSVCMSTIATCAARERASERPINTQSSQSNIFILGMCFSCMRARCSTGSPDDVCALCIGATWRRCCVCILCRCRGRWRMPNFSCQR